MSRRARKNVALTGFMAVGKSVVGQKLARRLKRPFVDLDHVIEETEGMKLEEIFSRKGEAYFRAAESRMLRKVLSQDGRVIATGGGAVMDGENLRLLKEKSFLVCLTAAPAVLGQRSGGGRGRPLLRGEGQERRIEELLRQRQKCYAQAHVQVDTTRLSVDQVVERIIQSLSASSSQPSAPKQKLKADR